MLNFIRFNKIFESKIINKYPYERMLVTINSYDDMMNVCSYLKNTFNLNVRIPTQLNHEYPNFACIVVKDIYENLFNINNTTVGVRFFSDTQPCIDDLKYFMDDNDNYVNIKDILNMDELHYIEGMIYNGKKYLGYKQVYKPHNNIYESNNQIDYPYNYIAIEVNSMGDINKIYDYIDKKYNKRSNRNMLGETIQFKNYIFIQVYKLKQNSTNYDLNIYSFDNYNGDIFNKIKDYSVNYPNEINMDDILNIDKLDYIEYILKSQHSRRILKNYNSNPQDRLVYENHYKYPYNDIVVRVNESSDIEKIYNYLENYYDIKGGWKTNPNDTSYPNYFFIPTIFINKEEFQREAVELSSYSATDEKLLNYYNSLKSFNLDDILDITEISSYDSLLKFGKKQSFKTMYLGLNKNVYESNTSTILNAFDLDETLVFNTTFEENIKHLLLEYKTPSEIFIDKINKKNINLSKLKYENGRIYFNDPMNTFNIDKYDADWVRKKDRVYLTQPDEYLLTDESLPFSVNEKLLELYNNSLNKCIITARLEISKPNLIKRLNKLGVKQPNYGLFMLNEKYSNKVKFKADTLINLQKKYHFEVINYYDDNIRLLKKMKEYFKENKINADINLFKVTKTDIRKI